jgi:hypothetical protein
MNSPPIESFPNDGVRRVVWAFGCLFPNRSFSNTPLIEVALRSILPNNELSEEAIVIKIAVAQVDTARLGTIWKGQSKTSEVWKVYGRTQPGKSKYSERELFEFDFGEFTSDTISFCTNNPSTDYGYIPPFLYPLKPITKEKGTFYRFYNSTFTRLISNDEVTVLVPSIEFFTSTYTPKEQQIRNNILQAPLDEVLAKYLNLDETGIDAEGNYIVSLKNNKHETNIAFLAYLSCNQESRNRFDKLRYSLLKANKNNLGQDYPNRFLEALPYHPGKMKLQCDGIWVDNHTFLALRVNAYSLPDENNIISIVTSIEYKKNEVDELISAEEPIPVKSRNNENILSAPIVSDTDPHYDSGVSYINSEVKVLANDLAIKELIHTKVKEIAWSRLTSETSLPVVALSSGLQNNGKESEGTAQLRQSEKDKNSSGVDQLLVLNGVKKALDVLPSLDNDIKMINYLSWEAAVQDNECYTFFPHSLHKKFDSHSWIEHSRKEDKKQYIPRGLLIARIVLKNGKKAYMLEIQRKSKSEAFSGLLFSVEGLLTKSKLYELLSKIVEYQGKYRRRSSGYERQILNANKSIELELPVFDHYLFDHQLGKSKWKDKILKVIAKSEKNGVFKKNHDS